MKKIIALISDDFEDLELSYPVLRLREAGCRVDIVGEEKHHVYHGKYGVPFQSDMTFAEVDPDEYDGILVPGGWAPDKLRRFPEVLEQSYPTYREESNDHNRQSIQEDEI